MKYRSLKKIWNTRNGKRFLVSNANEIIDIYDETDGEEIEKAVKAGVLELCEDQTIKNKHFMALMKPQEVKLQVLKTN